MTGSPHAHTRCAIVPPYLLVRLARLDDPRFAAAAEAARQSLMRDAPIRDLRAGAHPSVRSSVHPSVQPSGIGTAVRGRIDRAISDAAGLERLPGRLVRGERQGPVADPAVQEAWDGLGSTHALFWTVFERDSIDDRGLPLEATVHYGRRYDNAFWDGERMVFGDGDGQVFNRFTASLTVIGHELAHGVTQFTANLAYQGQSGAINESVSDVFGSLVEQYARGQSTAEASWLIGEGLFTDQVQGVALRSMKAPGTAYNDDVLGKDPQPANMSGYVETEDDNGGVHLNSGIPNRAFFLVASALGGNAWDAAGRIWFDTLTSGTLGRGVDFRGFARATARAALKRYGIGSPEHDAVIAAWTAVGLGAGLGSVSSARTGAVTIPGGTGDPVALPE
ncbi:M4 family peptidase [Cryobacterium sp. TMT1-21]|uniref:Neutral metalloproteinase n=1 Tax=Cryobacterium shii TaxID=1259235 RepID=A0AAQ2C808_9MICO|nr:MULTISPECIES: M4 family metallopeptidase [Cryobacterium]TFC51293.1 M4 family peptidase [Cryobacterium shii]TFC85194.1 M4 family peptidase [Cryobacterium sp. TmT2-59]TFD13115.1 M4 family peptidase [Cryobacterium sp. TMT1-21]TFD20559.1 M4 family peptidase [Cryobacterium sp. TMT4-10]TFD26207.1 M4 family peptidase [Cryobacterium sp. TMT2-23]